MHQGQPRHLAADLARLQAGTAMLGRPSPWVGGRQEELREWLHSAIQGGDAALRLVLHPAASCFTARLEPLPSAPSLYRLVPLPHPLNEGRSNPQAPHKGLSGPWSAAIRATEGRLWCMNALRGIWSSSLL